MTQEQGLSAPARFALCAVFWAIGAFLLALAGGVIDPGEALLAPLSIVALAGGLFVLFGFLPLLATPGRQNVAAVHALMCAASIGLGLMAAWVAFGDGGEGVTVSSSIFGMNTQSENEAEGRFGFGVMTVLCAALACISGALLVRRLMRRRD